MKMPSAKSRSEANQARSTQPDPHGTSQTFLVGIDVGSTTVKAVVCTEPGGEPLFRDYRRHECRQAEAVLDVLHRAKCELGMADGAMRLFMTGSGGQQLAHILSARFVQEVAAVSLAVESAHPEVRSVIELGGQDAKMILFQDGSVEGRRKKIATMNDKCAGGTGVIIEKIAAKLHVSREDLVTQGYEEAQIYPVAGKCGVFAETDITGLQKHGVPNNDLMASLFHAIVLQNLSVLTRGNNAIPAVFLLGGPNAFFPGLQNAWRKGLFDFWKRKNILLPDGASRETLVRVPPMAEYFAAMGAIEFGASEPECRLQYHGTRALETFIRENDRCPDLVAFRAGLCADATELNKFRAEYGANASTPPFVPGEVFIGLDGGSTSTKAVAITPRGDVVCASYRLSKSDPITDAVTVLRDLRAQLETAGRPVQVLGLGTTGYSKDLLKKVLSADVAVVETVAHAKSSLRLFPDVDAIIDVGGQDIKIIVLQNGTVKDFKLNTQCSAGNGYFLQAVAEALGIPVQDFADAAFRAKRMPKFSYGCAVFLQSDIVNFQRLGWRPEEILAGLATVLPMNVFLYVAGVSNVARLGRNIVLQGGTQRNLAVVKAELDFIHGHYHGDGVPEVQIHPHCCEAGAIGAALEVMERYRATERTVFPGFASLDTIEYSIRRDESTRCIYCTNRCLRTFVDLRTNDSQEPAKHVIIASCTRGEAETADVVRSINAGWSRLREHSPNYVQIAAEQVWRPTHPPLAIAKSSRGPALFSFGRSTYKPRLRAAVRIGIPRALNLFTYAPLFSAYFESLGVLPEHLHYSHFSSHESYQRAAGFSAIDPCYPSKVAVAHVFELLQHCEKEPLDAIFFPMFDVLTSPLTDCSGSNACPSGSATPEAVKAAFLRTVDWFEKRRVKYLNPVVDLADRDLFKFQMFSCWNKLLALDWEENSRAVDIAFGEWQEFEDNLRRQARRTLDDLEESGRVGLVMLGRPYHHDPGLNQGILDELQKLGYPVFSQSLLPLDQDLLETLFRGQLCRGVIRSPFDISDVFKQSFSASSNHKLWAAKFVARHPNLISVELSNFKCGHDAFISRTIEEIIERSGKPHFSFRDLDENRPLASIRIRVETMHYFLKHYKKRLQHSSRLTSSSRIARNMAQLPAPERPMDPGIQV